MGSVARHAPRDVLNERPALRGIPYPHGSAFGLRFSSGKKHTRTPDSAIAVQPGTTGRVPGDVFERREERRNAGANASESRFERDMEVERG
jgi:hypothetical protein